MAHSVEARVRTIVAETLNAQPENIRPETVLFAGIVSYDQMRKIVWRLGEDFGVRFAFHEWEPWSSVADVILAVERAIEARPIEDRAA
jgi:acyl carrier protein